MPHKYTEAAAATGIFGGTQESDFLLAPTVPRVEGCRGAWSARSAWVHIPMPAGGVLFGHHISVFPLSVAAAAAAAAAVCCVLSVL